MSIKPKTSPIYQTSVFTFEDLNELEAYFQQPKETYMYSRFANPNTDELGEIVCELEGGSGAIVTSSGMSAILTAVLTYCQSGDHVLCAEELYGGSATLITKELIRLGISYTYVPMDSLYDLTPFLQQKTKLMIAETMSNPLLKVIDVSALATECKKNKVKLVIDNTFASPIITKPLQLGADMVIHSVTKYLSGHSDVTAGVVVANEEDVERIQQVVMNYGLNLSPFESWLATRGTKTLKLRIKQHSQNALEIATYLEAHPKVNTVYYPGLEAHQDYTLAAKQGNQLFGGMLSFQIEDKIETVNQFMRGLQMITFSPSLAGVQTSISHPLKTSHRALTSQQQQKLGITMGLIRLSVGIEDVEEIISDLKAALELI
jgi:cystathionine beta-lyase/cystathionine gamma-synthase